jgi:hypothetical protein
MVPNTLTPCRRCWPDPKPTEGFVKLKYLIAENEALKAPVKRLGTNRPRYMLVAADALSHWLAKIRYQAELDQSFVFAWWTVQP